MKLLLTMLFLVIASEVAAHPPTGIVVDKKGAVFFSDLETVWKFDKGQLSVFRAGVRGRHVHELSIDAEDNIYGADVSYQQSTERFISAVWKMRPNGEFTYLLEPTADPPRGLHLWLDQHQNMYQVEQNNHTRTRTLLLRRTPAGIVTTLAGGAYGHADGKGTGAQFESVGGMFVTPDGVVYLADGITVRRIDADGTVTTIARQLDFQTSDDDPRLFAANGGLTGLAVDKSGKVFVADSSRRRVLKIDTQGQPIVLVRTAPPFYPNGVFEANGDLYVLEFGLTFPNLAGGPRVRKITPDGKSEILVTLSDSRSDNSLMTAASVKAEQAVVRLMTNARLAIGLVLFGLIITSAVFWQHRRRNL